MAQEKDPNHGAAVADENPTHSPMDETQEPRERPKATGKRAAGAKRDGQDRTGQRKTPPAN
jgi:hypothetical protein